MAALRARVFVLWAMLLAALPVLAEGDRYFCRTTERVITACCCGASEPTAARGETSAEIATEDCCERLDVDALNAAPALRDDGDVAHARLAVSPAPAVQVRAARVRDAVPQLVAARAPPLRGLPLFLAHCVLLI